MVPRIGVIGMCLRWRECLYCGQWLEGVDEAFLCVFWGD